MPGETGLRPARANRFPHRTLRDGFWRESQLISELAISRQGWQALDSVEQIAFIRNVIEGVRYNAATHRVSIRFRADAVLKPDTQASQA